MARIFLTVDVQVESGSFDLPAAISCGEYQTFPSHCFSSGSSLSIRVTLNSSEVTEQTYRLCSEEVIRQARREGYKEGFSEGVTSPYNKQWYDWDD